jgi:hypothetical protein
MKPLGHLFALVAIDLARASDATPPEPTTPDELTRTVSREEIAAAWRRWAAAEETEPRPGRRGLSLPAPRPGI